MTTLATINPWAIVLAAGWVALAAYCAGHTIGVKRANRTHAEEAQPLDELAETFDASLLPISDSEVARRIRQIMDENAAVRQLRADVDAWGA